MAIKKLIEVALPLDKINEAAYNERYKKHGHPSMLHLWYARRPMTTSRAVIWASLVDDPSSHPELFPSETEQNAERQRLFGILTKLVSWDNSNDEKILNEAKREIMRYTNNNPPAFLDPFAGGGAIPFEAHRLGLQTYAHDLNPVAVTINKAMIELPSKYVDCTPVNPNHSNGIACTNDNKGLNGLSADVLYYGNLLNERVKTKLADNYPTVDVSEDVKCKNAQATPIAWIWARTITCSNPACSKKVPLVKNFTLSKKKSKEIVACPILDDYGNLRFVVKESNEKIEPTVKNSGAKCPFCNQPISFEYIRNESKKGNMSQSLLSTVAEYNGQRIYVNADEKQIKAATVEEHKDCPQSEMPAQALGFRVQAYGLTKHKQLFTNRQILVLVSFINELKQIKDLILQDFETSDRNDDGENYANAVVTYLAFVIDKLADYNSTLCAWQPGGNKAANTFNRPALSMSWDFAEANPFCDAYGGFINKLEWVVESIRNFPTERLIGVAEQFDAQKDCGLRNIMISTDPPYYDNIGYGDLSDFFYVWLRQTMKTIYPSLFGTLLVPKDDELIATPFRNNGNLDKAKSFFENGMLNTCKQLFNYVSDDVPLSIYYAFKQSETDNDGEERKTASSGWETMLNAIIASNFAITGTWPINTELANRTRGQNSNALSTSIILICRKRPENAPVTTRRNFINELKRELRTSLTKLQSSNIAPVDMAQSAIGPGMGIFSKYAQVLEADGSPMGVRSALQIINQELDLYFNEMDGELDSNSRFCVDLYTQYGFNDAKFGDADTLARAKNTSVAMLQSKGVVIAEKGTARLIERENLPLKLEGTENMVWLLAQKLTHAMSVGGISACASIVHSFNSSMPEQAKALAYRLHSIAERKGWQEEAFAYNSLVIAWTDIQMAAARIQDVDAQTNLFS